MKIYEEGDKIAQRMSCDLQMKSRNKICKNIERLYFVKVKCIKLNITYYSFVETILKTKRNVLVAK